MAVVLLILKTIGLVILWILGILLALLLILLIMPISYRVKGRIDDPEGGEEADIDKLKKQSELEVCVSFLLFIKAVIAYPESLCPKVKLFGITVFPKKAKAKEEDKTEENELSITEAPEASKEERAEESTDASPADSLEASVTENVQEAVPQETSESAVIEDNKTPETEETPETPDGNKDDTPQKEKKPGVPISERLENTQKSYDKTRKKGEKILSILQSEMFKNALYSVRVELFRIIKHILPRKWEIKGTLGLAEPSLNGQVFALLGAGKLLYGSRIDIEPEENMDRFRTDLSLAVKGHLQLLMLVLVALRLLLNKSIRYMIRIIRKGI